MINAEKYLKNGIKYAEFADDLAKYIMNSGRKITEKYDIYIETLYFLTEEEKPQLTEDEKVILRNIPKEYIKIRRNDWQEIEFVQEDCKYRTCYLLSHLFKFIKERRRI